MRTLALSLTCLLSTSVLAGEHSAPCQQVLDWLNDGSLVHHLQPLNEQPSETERENWRRLNPERASLHDLRGSLHLSLRGRDTQVGEVIGGGSCADEQIEVIDRHNPESYPDSDDEALRWANWGTRDYLLKLDDELLVVSGRVDAEHSQAKLVSRLADDGSKQPLCLFERRPQAHLASLQGAQPELCQKVLDGATEALQWGEPQPVKDTQQVSLLPYLEALPQPMMKLDLDGDGREERLVRYDFDSGAGCGSSSQHLLLVDAQGEVLPRTGLNADLLERSWGPLSDSDERNISIFRLERQAYMLARLNWNDEVISLRALNQPLAELCHWREQPQYSLTQQF